MYIVEFIGRPHMVCGTLETAYQKAYNRLLEYGFEPDNAVFKELEESRKNAYQEGCFFVEGLVWCEEAEYFE